MPFSQGDMTYTMFLQATVLGFSFHVNWAGILVPLGNNFSKNDIYFLIRKSFVMHILLIVGTM